MNKKQFLSFYLKLIHFIFCAGYNIIMNGQF